MFLLRPTFTQKSCFIGRF